MNIAIIVPFRDTGDQKRQDQLDEFIPHMENFFSKIKGIASVDIFIIEQSKDGKAFNRGKLINSGFDYIMKDEKKYDSFIIHDVDLLPAKSMSSYYKMIPTNKVIHIASGGWDRYVAPNYIGGVTALSKKQFKDIDGFPNLYWGWGGEDDELYERITDSNIGVKKLPYRKGGFIDQEDMTLEEKLNYLRKNKQYKCMNKLELKVFHNRFRNPKWKPKKNKYTIKDSYSPEDYEVLPNWWGLTNVNYEILDEDSADEDSEISDESPLVITKQITVKLGDNLDEDGNPFENEYIPIEIKMKERK